MTSQCNEQDFVLFVVILQYIVCLSVCLRLSLNISLKLNSCGIHEKVSYTSLFHSLSVFMSKMNKEVLRLFGCNGLRRFQRQGFVLNNFIFVWIIWCIWKWLQWLSCGQCIIKVKSGLPVINFIIFTYTNTTSCVPTCQARNIIRIICALDFGLEFSYA